METNSAVKKQKGKPSKIDEMSKEQIRQAILKKRECNAKAQQIVESLLEKGINESFFLARLPDINQSHFDDVIEERSIVQLCGYPLCQNTLAAQEIPKQKYRISMKTNKVYDITARKHFCSNACYKSAMHIKKQMLMSPLWFREYEQMPIFNLLPLDTVGSLGQEIDVSIVDKVTIKADSFTSISDFTSASLNEVAPDEQANTEEDNKKPEITIKDRDERESIATTSDLSNVADKNTSLVNKEETIISTKTPEAKQKNEIKDANSATVKQPAKPVKNPLNIVGEIIEKPEQKIDPILTNAPEGTKPGLSKPHKKIQKKQPSVTLVIIEVEKCLAEWFTLDTMILLFGEHRVKEMVADKGEGINDYLNNYANSIFYSSNSYDQYQALCRKLNMLELEDKRLDAQALQRQMKPLPDYSIIKEESKKMQLKVKAFYAGETVTPDPGPIIQENTETSNEPLTQLPLVDKNAQNALRRRIVCKHLDAVLPDILRSLGMSAISIGPDVRMIVNTFKLKANNIMFKPIQWTLIAIIIIKLLSLRDRRLEHLLQQSTAFRHMQLLLLSFKQDGEYLNRLISWLTDIDRLLDTNDTQLTMESCK